MNIGKIEFEEPSEDSKQDFLEKFMAQSPNIEFVKLGEPKIIRIGWKCPVCNCGVRGDVEVCPNCVKRANKVEVAGADDEFPYLRSMRAIHENGQLSDEVKKKFGIQE